MEMIVNILPEMAKAVAEPISTISDVKIIGGDGNGISAVSENVPVMLAKTMESVKAATGIDMMDIVKASTYDAKVKREYHIDASVNDDSDVFPDTKSEIASEE